MVFGGLSWFGLRSPMSLPSLPPLSMPLHQIYSRRWTTESKRYLHVAKERKWMALQFPRAVQISSLLYGFVILYGFVCIEIQKCPVLSFRRFGF